MDGKTNRWILANLYINIVNNCHVVSHLFPVPHNKRESGMCFATTFTRHRKWSSRSLAFWLSPPQFFVQNLDHQFDMNGQVVMRGVVNMETCVNFGTGTIPITIHIYRRSATEKYSYITLNEVGRQLVCMNICLYHSICKGPDRTLRHQNIQL